MASYQSLYRKHRPQTFAALRGQEHVTAALRNAVKDGRVGHAYLFSGPRGTGKTTTARLLAKALNCLDLGSDGEPCDKCENCVAIAEGRFLDLIELDAASNNRVEEMRELLERVPLGLNLASKRKVYVFDEAHMLTGSSSNALLKTLEEPPDHVVFVLAMTEPEKLLPTIRSRTQHYEFTLFTVEQIVAEMGAVLEREGMPADPQALETIARAAAGSMRDALSLLDQALAHGTGRLDAEPVAELFGRTPFDVRCRILEAVAGEDAALVLTTLGELLEAGHEPRRIAEDLLRAARDGFLVTAGAGRVPLEMPDDEQKRLGDLGRALGNPTLVRMLETLGQAVVDMRGSDAADPRLVLEIALVRLTRRDAGPPLQTVVERIERLERAVDNMKDGAGAGAPAPPVTGGTPPGRTIGAIRREAAAAPPPEAEPEGLPSDESTSELRGSGDRTEGPSPGIPAPEGARPEELALDDVIVAWAAILPELPVATRSSVQEAQPLGVEDDVITFGVPPRLFEAASPRFRREADTIRSALSERLGRTARFTLVAHEGFAGNTAPERAPASELPETVDLTAEEQEPAVDPHELVDAAPDDRAGEPMQMLTKDLGATVVEERPRE
ncbi:MAG: DNA polymerase III subunit gamma/tau [Actinobacteria bacterium]|nr:DNA polymerase III subunit gamma/tau [Actinomycetota bacterium]